MEPVGAASICDPMSLIALWHQLVQGLVMSIGMGGGLTLFYTMVGTIIRHIKKLLDNSPSDAARAAVGKILGMK